MAKLNNAYWRRIEKVMKTANMNTNAFAKFVGLPRGENLYQIKRGNNKISLDVAQKIHLMFPEFSVPWLMFGEPGYTITGSDDTQEATLPLYYDLWTMRLPPEGHTDEYFVVSSFAANAAAFAVQFNGDPMTTPYYLRNTILMFRQQQPEEVDELCLCLIVSEKKRMLKFLERPAETGRLQMVSPVQDFQAPEEVDCGKVESLWRVCATVKKW